MIVLAEEAGAELAIGGQPDTGAVAAERLGHRGDEDDFAGCTVGKAVFACRLAAFVRYLLERPSGVDAAMDFRGWHYEAGSPVPVSIQRHELDKAHDDAGLAGVRGKGFDLIVVDAA